METVLVTGEIYHIFNRSIADYKIFNQEEDFLRFVEALRFYQNIKNSSSFSQFIKSKKRNSKSEMKVLNGDNRIVEIIAYCIMPTHTHLILKQLIDNGISTFMNNLLNSYTRYFNLKHNRKGPLWEGRFKRVLIKSDEQLLHLTRYIHLNPVTAYLVNNPEDWLASSYKEYIEPKIKFPICKFEGLIDIKPEKYKEFVKDRISYQRELTKIKDLLLEPIQPTRLTYAVE
ncbi:MAG: transposase [Candidatus Omnitrophica bacterium]|nr:transposase [Candidatus Omnitrophota bacterium]MCM8793078.1 transposase [Candidatus Omnitrophota bacterium]